MAEWLLLIYTLPAQPTRLRAAVWRDLKRVGASYLHDGVAILPATPEAECFFEQMTGRIRHQFGGKALLARRPAFDAADDNALIATFQEERAHEYRALLASCYTLLEGVVAQAEAGHFDVTDLERFHAELEHLRRQADQLRGRDYFRSPVASEVGLAMERAGRAVAGFALDVASGGRAAAATEIARLRPREPRPAEGGPDA